MPVSLFATALFALPAGAQAPIRGVRPAEPDIGSPVLGGIVLGLGGFFAGAYVGSRSANSCSGDDCGLEGAFYGAAIGGTFGMALGVHVGNRSRGNLGYDALIGAAVWTGGMVLGSAAHWNGTAATYVLVGIPIVQMIATISIERAEGRRRDQKEQTGPSVSIIPRSHGGTLSISMPLPRIR